MDVALVTTTFTVLVCAPIVTRFVKVDVLVKLLMLVTMVIVKLVSVKLTTLVCASTVTTFVCGTIVTIFVVMPSLPAGPGVSAMFAKAILKSAWLLSVPPISPHVPADGHAVRVTPPRFRPPAARSGAVVTTSTDPVAV